MQTDSSDVFQACRDCHSLLHFSACLKWAQSVTKCDPGFAEVWTN
jgi:hypothetical protein